MKAPHLLLLVVALIAGLAAPATLSSEAVTKPHVFFVMADDMGWGQTGYRGHPLLKTPNLDAMAANGLRFDRFYAGGPVCSPTRASMLTGRTHDRVGVLSHGYALRRQERTVAEAMRAAGYVTGHFGKWHLNGFRGPGAPIFADDPYGPGAFGFDEWVSVTNFYDLDPLMSRQGEFEEFSGDSSEVTVDEAVKFLDRHRGGERPVFGVVWFGSPHSPFRATEEDKAAFAHLDAESAHHYGELAAMDRSIGTLRAKLREFGLEKDTLLVFCSDNGGLPKIEPETVGGLRGFKGSVFEGGLRVPGIFEWPGTITPRTTAHPACVMDLFPTLADLLDLPDEVMVQPLDGISLLPLFAGGPEAPEERGEPIGFRYGKARALVGDRHKLLTNDLEQGAFELYDLLDDPAESNDLAEEQPEVFARMKEGLLDWDAGVEASFAGKDYPEGAVSPPDPEPVSWYETDRYRAYEAEWRDRWEFRPYYERSKGFGVGKGSAKGKAKAKAGN
jgi:arylsulfatase A-like enzyme